jgi:hypothetical protein
MNPSNQTPQSLSPKPTDTSAAILENYHERGKALLLQQHKSKR